MFAEGSAVIPKKGMEAIPQQMFKKLKHTPKIRAPVSPINIFFLDEKLYHKNATNIDIDDKQKNK